MEKFIENKYKEINKDLIIFLEESNNEYDKFMCGFDIAIWRLDDLMELGRELNINIGWIENRRDYLDELGSDCDNVGQGLDYYKIEDLIKGN